jgi:hypothetical protein
MLPSIIAMGAAFGKHPGAMAARLWSAGVAPNVTYFSAISVRIPQIPEGDQDDSQG